MTEAEPPLPRAFDSSPDVIRSRLAWARRAGHPRYVWQDLPVSAWEAGVRRVEEVVVQALHRRRELDPGEPPTLASDGAATARALGVAAFTTGTGPLLGHWMEAGDLHAEVEIASVLAAHLAHARARARRVDALLQDLKPNLDASGLRPVVLKGVHTGRRFFPEPGMRPSADIDLLVPPSLGDEMERCLQRAGYTLLLRQRRPTRSVWRPPDDEGILRSLDLTHALNPLTLDLHLSLGRGFYGVSRARVPHPSPDDLAPIPGLPAPYTGLCGPLLLLSLCLHASEDLYNVQLLALLEVSLVARGTADGEAPWPRFLEAARRARALGDVFAALALAARLDPGAVPQEAVAAARADAPPALQALVDRVSPATAQRLVGVTLGERLAGARTPAEKLRRIAHMVIPDSAGGSLRSLAGLYATRLYKLLAGRVSVGRGPRRPH